MEVARAIFFYADYELYHICVHSSNAHANAMIEKLNAIIRSVPLLNEKAALLSFALMCRNVNIIPHKYCQFLEKAPPN
jgi:hypothetical protein